MYRALLERDPGFEGVFVVAVKTTKIFCRPTCPARKPKASNVEYFANPQTALLAGYRACLRCRPMLAHPAPPQILLDLIEAIEQAPAEKLREQDLRTRGLDPSTVRRQFQKHFGMTFHAYQRARRMGLALHEVRSGKSVVDSQQNTGYDSASGFWQSFRKVFGEPPSKSSAVNCLLAKWIDTPLGAMLSLADDEGIHLLEFVDRRALENEIAILRKKMNCAVIPGENVHLKQIDTELADYFSGRRLSFRVPIILHGTDFERQVWHALRKIGVGQCRSYGCIAESLGRPAAVRAVGRANGKNSLAIVVPCHRVIGSNGKLTGYGGGLWRKQWLLDHEKKYQPALS